ncbi:hypothetical protein AB0B89_09220 [Sphaerisporangium sp. NPDC049002]
MTRRRAAHPATRGSGTWVRYAAIRPSGQVSGVLRKARRAHPAS